MEPEITQTVHSLGLSSGILQNAIRLDRRSLAGAVVGGIGFWLLALLSIWLTREDALLAAVWLPNAFAVAFLLRARLPNEVPFAIASFAASVLGNTMSGTPTDQTLVYSIANITAIIFIVQMTRRTCGPRPDMTEVSDLAWFVWAGGVVGPMISVTLASSALEPAQSGFWSNALAWYLTESMAMVLIVPTALLIHDAIRERVWAELHKLIERTVVLLLGLAASFLVLVQGVLPLLFVIPPITLLHAFRLGSLGTAIFVSLLAALATVMTRSGYGPMAVMVEDAKLQIYVIQAFMAANFLTGLPVAAVLAGRTRMTAAIAEDKLQLDLLANNITDAVLRYDIGGFCTYASPSTREVLGAEPSEFLGKRPSDRMHSDAQDRIVKAQDQLLSGVSDKERFTYRRFIDAPDGSAVYIEAECAAASNPVTGEREGIIVSLRDVTQRVELELLLTSARRRAENAARAKSEFLANMSHEIRTPMNGVLGFAEMILESDLDQDQRRQAKMIVESGRTMMLLLNDILDLSKIEAGQIAINHEPVDLRSTILDCAALHRPAAERKGLDLRIEFDALPFQLNPQDSEKHCASVGSPCMGESYPWIMSDGLRLRQVLLNLIGNAVKFTEEGRITVHCSLGHGAVSVQVIDTGIGISESRQEAIFTPFTQGESSTARRFGGTGLGLSISRKLADLLGGTITVESEPGTGSIFMLTLPATLVEPVADSLPSDDLDGPETVLSEGLQTARILLAEDHDINRELVIDMLERCGQDVAIAHDGNEAISMVIDAMVRGRPYDLVLMDVQMPGCDGYAATRAIRAEGIGPNDLPIIALTANAFAEDIAAARDAGMQAHLSKPLAFSALARTLQRWLPTRIVSTEDQTSVAQILPPLRPQSPAIVERWSQRKAEACAAVCDALERGALGGGGLQEAESRALAMLLHKIAGTAAMFGEADLGERAGALERALLTHGTESLEPLAREMIALAARVLGEPYTLEDSAL